MRRSLALVVLAPALAGCESYEVTRLPDPPISRAGSVLIVAAVVAVGLGWLVFALRWLVRDRRLSGARWALGAFYTTGTLLYVGYAAFDLLARLRMEWILDGGPCRSLPSYERPRQILQLTCSTDDFWGSGALVLVVLLPVIVLFPLCAWAVTRSDARPWVPTIVPAGLLATLVVVGFNEGLSPDGGAIAQWAAATAGAAALTACGLFELTARAPTRSPSSRPPLPHPGRLRADRREDGSFVDRLQALVIDLLGLMAVLTFVGGHLEGPAMAAVATGLIGGYLAGGVAMTGGTLGHRLVGLTVVDAETRRRPSPSRAALRVLVLLGGPVALVLLRADWRAALVWLAVLLAPMLEDEGRPLHDLVAGTRVLRAR